MGPLLHEVYAIEFPVIGIQPILKQNYKISH